MNPTWTTEQIKAERDYRMQERLGILCGSREPTQDEIDIAFEEAEMWERSITSSPSPPQ